MKLHLPKQLFTALLAAITLAAAPAALTLGSAAWGAAGDVNNLTMGNAPGGFYGGNYAFNFQIGKGDLGEGDTSDVLALYWGDLNTGNLWSNGFTLGPLTDDGGVTLIVGAGALANAGASGGSAAITEDTTFTPGSAADRNKTFSTSLQTGKTYTLVNVGANQNQTVMLLEDGVYKETVTYNGNMHGGVMGTVMGSVWNTEYDPSNVQVWNGKGETAEFLKANFVGGATQLADSDLIFADGMTDVVTTVTLAQDTSAKSISVYDNYTFATTGATADVKLSVTGGITVAAGKTLTLSGTQTSALVLDSTINDGAVKIDGTVKAGSNLVISDNGSVTVGDGSLLVLGDILTHNNGVLVTEGTGALTIDRGAFFANVANATLVSDTYHGGAVAGNGFLEYEVDILEGNVLSNAISVQTITRNGSETVQTTSGVITTLGSTYYINSGTETYRGADNTESGAIAGATGFVVQNGTLNISKDGNISTIKSLDIGEDGEVRLTSWNASLGSANSLVDVTLSDGGIFSFGNGNSDGGGGKMYLNLTVDGSGTLGGSTNGNDSNVYGTVQGHGVLTLTNKVGNNGWSVAAAISDDAEDALALNVTGKVNDYGIVLSGANTYTGGTTIEEGALLKTNHATALGSGTVTLNGGTLALKQGLTISELSSTVAKSIVKSDANATLTVSSGSYAGALQNGSGTLSLTKKGAGTLTLSGANTYTGNTSVQGGELVLTSASALSSGSITISKDAKLTLQNQNYTIAQSVSGEGELVVEDGVILTFDASNGSTKLGTNLRIENGGRVEISGSADYYDQLNYDISRTVYLEGSAELALGDTRQTVGNWTFDMTGGTISGQASVGLDFHRTGSIVAHAATGATLGNPTVSTVSANIRTKDAGEFTLSVEENARLDLTGSLELNRKTIKADDGLAVIRGTVKTLGEVEVQKGTLELQSSASTASAISVSSGAELEISAGTSALSGAVTNNGAITVSGGSATLSGAVTNNGAITVSGGTADFTKTLGMGTGSSLSVSGGSATVSGALNVTGTGVQIGQSGNGELNLTGSMSVGVGADATLSGAITLGHTITNDGSLTLDGTISLTGDIDSSYEHRARGETSYALAGGTDSTNKQNGFMTVEGASYYLTQSSDGVTNAVNTLGSNFATNTADNKVVYHGTTSYKVDTDNKGLYFSTGDITGTQYYITTDDVVVNKDVQDAATGYTLQGGTMQLTAGSVNTTPLLIPRVPLPFQTALSWCWMVYPPA